MATTYPIAGVGTSKREGASQSRMQSAGVGSLGNHEIYKRHYDSSRLNVAPVAQEGRLPRAGMRVERQEYRSIESLPIVFSEISGREQVSVFIPQKGTGRGILTKKGSPTFYDHTSGMKGLCKVLYADTADPTAPLRVGYVKIHDYATKQIKDIGENHNPEKKTNYSFANNVCYFAGDVSSAFGGSVLTGGVNFLRAGSEWEAASRINDVAGKQFAISRYLRSGFEVTKGVLSALGKAASGWVAGGNYLFLCYPMFRQAIESWNWTADLDKTMKTYPTNESQAAAGLQFLLNKIEVAREEKEGICKEVFTPHLYALVQEEVLLNQDEEDILHRRDREEIAQILEQWMAGIDRANYPLIADWDQVRLNVSIRLMKQWAHHKMVREAEYGRAIGGNSLSILKKELREERGLAHKLYYDQGALAEVLSLLATVKADANWNIQCTAFTIVGCILAFAGTIAAAALSGGTAPFVINLALQYLPEIIGTLLDLYWFYCSMRDLGDSSYKERVLIVLFSLLGCVGAYLSFDTIDVVAAMSLMAMLAINIFAIGLSITKEKEAAEARIKKAEEKRISEQQQKIREEQMLAASSWIHPAF